MQIATPICKQLCVDCEHVLNQEKGEFFLITRRFRTAPSYKWKCASKKKIDCTDGSVEFDSCRDNYCGDCERFLCVDTSRYDPKEHRVDKKP